MIAAVFGGFLLFVSFAEAATELFVPVALPLISFLEGAYVVFLFFLMTAAYDSLESAVAGRGAGLSVPVLFETSERVGALDCLHRLLLGLRLGFAYPGGLVLPFYVT